MLKKMRRVSENMAFNVDVICVFPVLNCSAFLDEAIASVWAQDYDRGRVVLSAYDDGSSDDSYALLQKHAALVPPGGRFTMVLGRNERRQPLHQGVAFARNSAVEQGRAALVDAQHVVLAFFDADDVMQPTRLSRQVAALTRDWCVAPQSDVICGSCFERIPAGSTPRYTAWHNSLRADQLTAQMFRETTVAQPTWAMSLQLFDNVGAYDAREQCEDLDFLYRHVARGGRLLRIDESLTLYRLNESGASRSIGWLTLLSVRMRSFEKLVLERHVSGTFAIWGAGRDGRRFFRALSDHWQRRVAAFCDIDPEKLALGCFHPPPPYRCEIRARINSDAGKAPAYANKGEFVALFGAATHPSIPIVRVDHELIKPPCVMCVALDRTDGDFERSIPTHWVEGTDFWHFA
jgi:ribonuclease P protein subunit RPP14